MLNKKVLCAQDFSSTKANIPEIDDLRWILKGVRVYLFFFLFLLFFYRIRNLKEE